MLPHSKWHWCSVYSMTSQVITLMLPAGYMSTFYIIKSSRSHEDAPADSLDGNRRWQSGALISTGADNYYNISRDLPRKDIVSLEKIENKWKWYHTSENIYIHYRLRNGVEPAEKTQAIDKIPESISLEKVMSEQLLFIICFKVVLYPWEALNDRIIWSIFFPSK